MLNANLDLEVWKKRRSLHRLGALIHWEYWAIFFAISLPILAYTIQLTKRTARLNSRKIILRLWIILTLLAISNGITIANIILDPILNQVWNEAPAHSIGRIIFKIFMILLWLRLLTGLARLEATPRKITLILFGTGFTISVATFVYLGWSIQNIPRELIQEALSKIDFQNGLKYNFTAKSLFFYFTLSLSLSALIWWFLFSKKTRDVFMPNS